MAPRLLIFDLDGTLIDSAPDIIGAVNGLVTARGLAPLPAAQIRAAVGKGLRSLLWRLFPETQTDAQFLTEFEADFRWHYERNLLGHTTVYPGVFDFLDAWQGRIGIATNKDETFAKQCVEGLGLGRFPWVRIFGADSLAAKKPDPLPLLEIMRAAGIGPAETVMIGDGIPDMEAAGRAGVRAIAAEYGYADIQMLREAGATTSFSGFAVLGEALKRISDGSVRTISSGPDAASK